MAPTIAIDDEVLALLKGNAEPFVDTPNSVLRRLLGMSAVNSNGSHAELGEEPLTVTPERPTRQRRRRRTRRPQVKRAQTGTILADEEYEIPILSILDAHGGRAPTREVLEELGSHLANQLMPADHETLASGDIRWRNRAQFVRLRLIEQGDMVKGSPRGLWEIADQGRDRLVAE